MVLVVLGTIVTYFVFLPTSAPKQLLLAVLPFGGEQAPSFLTRGFPSDLRNNLALSRDIKVIDFQAAVDVFQTDDFRGIMEELGVTHFVDGTIESFDGDFTATIHVRLVNATHAVWKEVWQVRLAVQPGDWVATRNSLANSVRDELYDQVDSIEVETRESTAAYFTYLQALDAFHARHDPFAIELLSKVAVEERSTRMDFLQLHLRYASDGYLFDSREMFDPLESRMTLEDLKEQLQASQDLGEFKLELEKLVSDYPNGYPASALADFYIYAGWYEEARSLLYHWAQLRPKSFNVGVRLAHVDFLEDDLAAAERSLQIAEARSQDTQGAAHWHNVLNYNTGKPVSTDQSKSSLGKVMTSFQIADLEHDLEFQRLYEASDCDAKLETSLYLNDLYAAGQQLDCARRLWVTPPIFWKPEDPRWVQSMATQAYLTYLRKVGYSEPNLAGLSPLSNTELFMPRRGKVFRFTSLEDILDYLGWERLGEF